MMRLNQDETPTGDEEQITVNGNDENCRHGRLRYIRRVGRNPTHRLNALPRKVLLKYHNFLVDSSEILIQ